MISTKRDGGQILLRLPGSDELFRLSEADASLLGRALLADIGSEISILDRINKIAEDIKAIQNDDIRNTLVLSMQEKVVKAASSAHACTFSASVSAAVDVDSL
jgi:hypothetical protein